MRPSWRHGGGGHTPPCTMHGGRAHGQDLLHSHAFSNLGLAFTLPCVPPAGSNASHISCQSGCNEVEGQSGSVATLVSGPSALPQCSALQGLQLGHRISSGSFGRVFHGTWWGSQVGESLQHTGARWHYSICCAKTCTRHRPVCTGRGTPSSSIALATALGGQHSHCWPVCWLYTGGCQGAGHTEGGGAGGLQWPGA